MSWADVQNKPSGKRAKKARMSRWVDADKAERIYSEFTRWDRPSTEYGYLWGRKPDEASVARLKTAATMVQTFVDALSGKQANYTVSLNSEITTAATDLKNRVVQLPARTILDPEISEQEAALLCVGFLGHEIGHIRFDNDLDKSLQSDPTLGYRLDTFNSLSTILREARVEAGFNALFPGYTGLFEPLLRWVSRGTPDGSTPPEDALGFAVAATRYPFRFDWSRPEHVAERDWWQQWVAKYATAEDYPTHKQALDEAYEHITKTLNSPLPKPYSTNAAVPLVLADQKQKIAHEAWEAQRVARLNYNDGTIDYEDYRAQVAEISKKARAAKTAATRQKNKQQAAQASIPASVEQVNDMLALQEGSKKGRARKKVQDEIESARTAAAAANNDLGMTGNGSPIRAARVGPKQARAAGRVEPDYDAIGIFRSTFMRLRGGNDGRIGSKRSGRLDDRHVFRLADKRDDRVFTRRGAPKTQRLRVYLMVDTSASMRNNPVTKPEDEIRSVSKALIEASIGADNLTLEVWGWDNDIAPVWMRGDDPDDVLRLQARGGTADADALKFAADRMEKELRVGEHGLIIMMSDGNGRGESLLRYQAEAARRKGMSVFGITMDEELDQTEAYGKDGFIRWQGSVSATAMPLAQIISQSWMTKDQHRA